MRTLPIDLNPRLPAALCTGLGGVLVAPLPPPLGLVFDSCQENHHASPSRVAVGPIESWKCLMGTSSRHSILIGCAEECG